MFDSVRSLWSDDEEPERPAARRGESDRGTASGPGRPVEEHEEEGGGGLLGMVANAIRNPREAAAVVAGATVGAVTMSIAGPTAAADVAASVTSGVDATLGMAGSAVADVADGTASMGASALRAAGANDMATRVQNAPAQIARAAGQVQETAAHTVDHDLREALVGNGEDGEGLIGGVANAATALSTTTTEGVRRLASNPHVARGLEIATHGTLTSEEILEEADDINRGFHDMIDEDLRDVVAGEHVQGLSDEEAEFRLEGDDQLEVERRARQLFDATDGAGSTPEEITASMRGAGPETIRAMEALMWREHGIDMRHRLDRELSGSAEDEIFGVEGGPGGMLSGDPVEQAMSEIGGATHGTSTDSERIESALRTVPEGRRAEVIERMGGREEMQAQLRRETRGQDPAGTDADVAMAVIEGRDADAIALRLDESLNRGVGETLGRVIGVDDADISNADRQLHGWMMDTVGDVLGRDDAERARAAREIGPHTPYFAALNDLVGNQDEVASQLERIPPEQREAVQRSFARITRGENASLDGTLRDEMEDGPEQDRAIALLEGNQPAADAAALQLAADQPLLTSTGFVEHVVLGPIALAEDLMNGGRPDVSATDTEGFMRPLERREGENDVQYAERRRSMNEILRTQYGSDVEQLMAHELGEGSLDHQRAQDLNNDGELTTEFQIRYASEREFGTDDEMLLDGIRREMENPEITDARRAELRELAFEGPFSELDGRPALQAQEILEGPPADDAAQVDRWLRRHEFDRDTVGRALVDVHSQSGTDYDRHMGELQAIRSRMTNGSCSTEDRERFEEIGRILEGDQASYRTRQDETAEVAQQAAAAAAALAVTVASAGTLSPVAAAALAAGVGGAAGMAMRGAVQGDAYEREDIGADAARTAASAAGGASSQALQALGPANLATRALTQVPSAVLTHGTDLALTDRHLTWGDVGSHVAHGGAEVLATGLGETAEDHLGARLGPGMGNRMIAEGAGGALESATGSALTTDWSEGVGEGLADVAGDAVLGGAQSVAMAAVGHHHDERQERLEREAVARHLEGSTPRRLAIDEPDAGDVLRAEMDRHEAVPQHSPDPGHVVSPEAARAANADDARSLIEGLPSEVRHVDPEEHRSPSVETADALINEIHSPPRLIVNRDAARAANADTTEGVISELDDIEPYVAPSYPRLAVDAEAARAADADSVEDIGTAGYIFDRSEVPGPGEPVNYPPNHGAAGAWRPESLAPATRLDREGHPGGRFFSPEGAPVPNRSLPPNHSDVSEEHFYEVGPDGLPVMASTIAPAFGQPGGATQYRAHASLAENPARLSELVEDGRLIETQANYRRPVTPEEYEDIMCAVDEEETAAAEAARRRSGA